MFYDVAIIGGGLMGGGLARALGQQGLSVCVIDAGAAPIQSDDHRVSAVAATSKYLMERIGIWPLLQDHATPIHTIAIHDHGAPSSLTYDYRDLESPEPLGYMIPNTILRHQIYQAACDTPQVTWLANTTPAHLHLTEAARVITLTSGEQIECRLLIGADGKSSWVRDQLAIPVTEWAYPQTAVVGVCEHPYDHQHTAVEYFAPEGPLALLPMPSDGQQARSALVWSCSPTLHHRLMKNTEEEAASFINQTYIDHRGPLTKVHGRQAYPLSATLPTSFIAPRACLIGDAAHAIHPVAGQGANVGFRDIAELTVQIGEAQRLGLDIGSLTVLEKFAQGRQFDHVSMTLVTDAVVSLFGPQSSWFRVPRQTGLAAVNHLGFIKRRLMRHAMGYSHKAGVISQLGTKILSRLTTLRPYLSKSKPTPR